MSGRKIGPPNLVGEDTFQDFETWILENKIITCMTDNLGCKTNLFVVTGNGNGLAGFALSKAKTSLKTAKNRAGQRLMYIPRYKEHTVLLLYIVWEYKNISKENS